jgi:hypothetical protein
MVCPKCGFDPVPDAACPRCGVVIARYRVRPAADAPAPPVSGAPAAGAPRFRASFAPEPEPPSALSRLLNAVFVLGLLAALAGSVAWLVVSGRQRPARDAAGDETSLPISHGSASSSESSEGSEQATPPPFPPPPQASANEVRRLPVEDREALADLVHKLNHAMVKGV